MIATHHNPPKLKPQTQSILRHLQTGQSLTDAQARELFGITRLGARIHELKEAGYRIDNPRVTVKTRHGESHVTRYSLIPSEE